MFKWQTVKGMSAQYNDKLDYSKIEYSPTPSGEELMQMNKDDPLYSLEVDPTGKLNMDEDTKEFVRLYCEYKNLAVVANLLGMDPDAAKTYMNDIYVMQEIRRINKAQYRMRIATKMMSLDEIGGYLTTLIADDVPIGDQVSIKEKMNAARMIIDINKLKQESMSNHEVIEALPVEDLTEKLSKLSTNEIKALIYKETSQAKINETMAKKNVLIEKIDPARSKLTPEERSVLETLSIEELDNLVLSNKVPSDKFKEMLKEKKQADLAEKQRQADLNLGKTMKSLKDAVEEENK